MYIHCMDTALKLQDTYTSGYGILICQKYWKSEADRWRYTLTSPSSICVATSTPVLAGTNSGVGGRSRKASVCVVTSASSTRSVISSRYSSVWTSTCLRPSTASGERGRSCSRARLRATALRRDSCCLCSSRGSG